MSQGDFAVDQSRQADRPQAANAVAAMDDAPASSTKFPTGGAIPPVAGGFTDPKPAASELAFEAKPAAPAQTAQQGSGPWVRGPGDGGPDGGVNAQTTVTAGESGMVAKDIKTKVGGNDATIPKGTFVEVVSVADTGLTVKVWSSFGGAQAVIPQAVFSTEPALTNKEEPGHTNEPEDYTYQPYGNPLWNGSPSASDVAQGAIGDCYLMSAMGAVAAANPQAIMSLFSPQTPGAAQYTVTLYVRDASYKLVPKTTVIDGHLPSRGGQPMYGQMQHDLNDGKNPMWPALLEKAYAQLIGGAGGYQRIGGGGFPGQAMAAFTGKESQDEAVPQDANSVVDKFRELQKAGKAVVCATLGQKSASQRQGFTGAGDGPYSMMLTGDSGDAVELVQGSLSITDSKGKAPAATDDGAGNITGAGVHGQTGYGWNATPKITYDAGKGPAAAADLRADYQWRGQLDKNLDVYANHAYMFQGVTPDGKIQFKNPWGVEHPAPMTGDDFKRLFIAITDDDAQSTPSPTK